MDMAGLVTGRDLRPGQERALTTLRLEVREEASQSLQARALRGTGSAHAMRCAGYKRRAGRGTLSLIACAPCAFA